MTVGRLHEGDEDAAVRVVEDLKFRMDEVVGVSVDPAYMRRFLADDRHYFIVACVADEPLALRARKRERALSFSLTLVATC